VSALSLLLLLLASSEAAAAPPVEPVELVFHADIGGRFAAPGCGMPDRGGPDYAALAATIRGLRPQDSSRAPPIVLLGGNVIGPGFLAREMLRDATRLGALDLARVLGRSGYDAVALGGHELRVPRAELEHFAAAMAASGMPLLATNLTCDGGKQAFCRHLVRERVVVRGGRKVGIIATLARSLVDTIPKGRLEGLEVEEELEAVRTATRRLRGAGAHVVVLLAQASSRDSGPVYELQRSLARQLDAPDAILATSLFERDGDDTVRLHLADRAPPIVGSTAGTRSVSAIDLWPRWEAGRFAGGRVRTTAVRADAAVRDGEVEARLRPHLERFCARYGHPVSPGKLVRPMSRNDFLDYVLAIMRKRGQAEIALVHRSFASKIAFPLEGQLRRLDLERAMPYEASIGVVRLSGDEVKDLLARRAQSPHLGLLEIDAPDGALGDIEINGRELDEARSYRVVVTDFLAQGGDGVLGDEDLEPRWIPGDLRELVGDFLARHTADEDGDPGVDLETDFGKPAAERTLLLGTGELGLDLSDLYIQNRASYADEPLSRNQQRTVHGALGGNLRLRHPAHSADARMRLEYGLSATSSAEEQSETSGETQDLVSWMLLYSWIGLRDLAPESGRRFVPSPYTRLLFETELTQPAESPEQTRSWRHAEITHTAGGQWTPLPSLRLRAGAGYRRELGASDRSSNPEELRVADTRLVAEGGAILDPIKLGLYGSLRARFEATADYRFLALEGEHELTGAGTLSITIYPPLFLTATLEGFTVRRGTDGFSTAIETRIGVKVLLDGARQAL
jgi:2',3'-cyclic-nucleotide 2'-phosphodiesterase (5'-nucleotidase family)